MDFQEIDHIKNKQIMEIVIQFILASKLFEVKSKPDLFHTLLPYEGLVSYKQLVKHTVK